MIDDAQRRLVRRRPEQRGADGREAELEGVLMDAVAGESVGPALAKTLERLAREVLLRRGLGDATVIAHSNDAGTFVRVLLPPGKARVAQVQVKVGAKLGG